MSEHDRGDTRGIGVEPVQQQPVQQQSAHQLPAQTHSQAPFALSRRTLVKTAAGAGVAAAAVGMVGVAHADGNPNTSDTSAAGAPLAAVAAANGAKANTANGPVVVHVTDFAHGTLEVFTNGARTQVTDVDLANRIARAATNR